MTDNRLNIITLEPHAASATFADDVRTGLGAKPKSLPPKYFYDELGSKLFEAICLLPEYYPTRAEREILDRYADDIAASVPGPVELIELGSGNAQKTRLLIRALLDRQPELHFLPIDISDAALESSSQELLDSFPALHITGYASDYLGALDRLKTNRTTPRLVLFLGSNIGNLDAHEARELLRRLRATLATGDALLLGADLKKDRSVLEDAYDDPTGVTAAFNLNVLARINRELDANFDVRRFAHRAHYDEEAGCVRIHIVSLCQQTAYIRAIDTTVVFDEGETIHTENSHKYALEDLSRLANDMGFIRAETWFDDHRRFSSNLFVVE